jgi:hypothetical protein
MYGICAAMIMSYCEMRVMTMWREQSSSAENCNQ